MSIMAGKIGSLCLGLLINYPKAISAFGIASLATFLAISNAPGGYIGVDKKLEQLEKQENVNKVITESNEALIKEFHKLWDPRNKDFILTDKAIKSVIKKLCCDTSLKQVKRKRNHKAMYQVAYYYYFDLRNNYMKTAKDKQEALALTKKEFLRNKIPR